MRPPDARRRRRIARTELLIHPLFARASPACHRQACGESAAPRRRRLRRGEATAGDRRGREPPQALLIAALKATCERAAVLHAATGLCLHTEAPKAFMEELREAHEAAERALHAASSRGTGVGAREQRVGLQGVMRDARKSKSFQARLNRGGKLECPRALACSGAGDSRGFDWRWWRTRIARGMRFPSPAEARAEAGVAATAEEARAPSLGAQGGRSAGIPLRRTDKRAAPRRRPAERCWRREMVPELRCRSERVRRGRRPYRSVRRVPAPRGARAPPAPPRRLATTRAVGGVR